MSSTWIAVLAAALVTTPVAVAMAQEYPTKPITMIVPFSAGGPTDTVARLIAQAMTKDLKQTVLLGGQIDMTCDQTTNTTGPIKAGKIKVYCATTKTKVPSLPDVPTCDAAGLPNFGVSAWHALYAPKGTPKPIIDRLAKSLQVALKDPAVIQRFADLGTEPVAQNLATPEALRTQLKSEVDRWAPIIKKAGVYAE